MLPHDISSFICEHVQEPTEEDREQREAQFEEQLRARVVRSDLIGRDRHFRRYYHGKTRMHLPSPAHGNALVLSMVLLQSE